MGIVDSIEKLINVPAPNQSILNDLELLANVAQKVTLK